MSTSCASATIAATDIFHSRKYAQISRTTSTRKTRSPRIARSATCSPHEGPMRSWLMSSTPATSRMVLEISAASSAVSGSVCTRMVSSPEVLAIGAEAFAMPESATIWRISSAFASVTWPSAIARRYSTPPSNSMPQLSFWTKTPKRAIARMTAEMVYQVRRRPTKSTETVPS
jgi:hypothetical protein